MFIPIVIALTVWILYMAATSGPRRSLWVGWMTILLLIPTWLVKNVGSLQLDARSVLAAVILLGFFIFPEEKLKIRWLWLDTFVLLLVATQVVSGLIAGEIRPLTIPEITRRWLPAYIMGRLFFQSMDDLDRVLPIASRLVLVLSIFALGESFLKFNFINEILGKHFAVLEAGEGYRWGIKRAQGPLIHPIFFGMMLVMLFPWALEAGRRARHKMGPRWWLVLPLLVFASVVCTASRGAIIATLLTVYATFFFRRPKWRMTMAIVMILAAGTVYFGKDAMVQALSRAAGESRESVQKIVIAGEEHEYTGTKHRLLLYKVYADAIRQAGLFGYGEHMRGVPIEEHLVQRFGSIDNHYLLFLLERGYVGICCFLTVTLFALGYLAKIAWDTKDSQAGFAAALFGSLFGVALLLSTVWFAPDFAVVWLFCAGLAGSMHSLPRSTQKPAIEKPEASSSISPEYQNMQRKITPAWAPKRETKKDD